jgi:hypothetical protein
MTVDEYREALAAAMDAYESARREDEPYQIEVKVDPVVYTPPVVQQVVVGGTIFMCGLFLGILIGRWRK